MKIINLALGLALSLAVCAPSHAQCTRAPVWASALRHRPNTVTFTRVYRNGSYGFDVPLPRGLSGYAEYDPNYQRGFAIPLRHDRASVNVFAEVNSLEFPDARAALAYSLDLYKKDVRAILKSGVDDDRVGGATGRRLSLDYTCPGSRQRRRVVETVVLSPISDTLYTIIWSGAPAEYARDEGTLRRLKDGWRFTKPR